MIGAGLVGAAIAGVIVDYTKKFILVTKLCFAFAILGLIAFTVVSIFRCILISKPCLR